MDVSAYTLLQDRPPIGRLRERDIDLLLCSELHVVGPLRERFAALWGAEIDGFEGAWVSHDDEDGESDLIVTFKSGTATLVLLVENKVAAGFQPEQQDRYRARAERWQRMAPYPEVKTVLVAPADYFGRSGADRFDVRISYEDLIEALREETPHKPSDPRSRFLGQTLQAGIASHKERHQMIRDEAVSAMWQAIYDIASTETPLLNIPHPGARPKGAGFIRCPRAKGFSPGDSKRVQIVLKRNESQKGGNRSIQCHVDLEFGHMAHATLEQAVSGVLDDDMHVVQTGQSASIRIDAPPIDFLRCPDEQADGIRQWLGHAERLRQFFVRHRPLTPL